MVQRRGLTGDVSAGINWGLGNMFDYNGPMLWIAQAYHDPSKPADSLVTAFNVAVTSLQTTPVDSATLKRALVKMRSDLYTSIEQFAGFGKANLLASFALFDDDPGRINRLESEFAKVTPALLQKTAQEYLRPTNRTIFTIVPALKSDSTKKSTER